MKRATALKVLAATLAVLTVASAVPVAYLLTQEAAFSAGSSSPQGRDSPSSQGSATRGLPFGPAGHPDAEFPAGGAGEPGGPSSRPALPGAAGRGTGSALLDQVLGAARLMGLPDVELPDLPLHKLEPVNPLRAAILGWIVATNAQVPADELAQELARADALPDALQRDLALLVLSATEATILQREATALLSPEQLAWIHAHPELAAAMAEGIVTPETRQLAALSALVDMEKSLQASLLLLTAVEATRGSLASPEAADGLKLLDGAGELDPAANALLQALARAGAQTSDADKVRFAAELVAVTTGARVPAPAAPVSFEAAIARLASATGQTPDPDALPGVLARASALPDDLESALASLLVAQALAVEAAAPGSASTQAQGEALARVLVTVAQALPVLEKHSLYWSNAPDALRVAQWEPQLRIGWALEHAAYFMMTRGDPADAVRASALLRGTPLQDATVPERSFVDAYIALQTESGGAPNATMVQDVRRAGDVLDARVQRAAALLMSGAAESIRLQRVAYAALTPEEQQELLSSPPLDGLLLDPAPTSAALEQAARISLLAAKVDRAALARAQLVAVLATTQARDVLDGMTTQGDARPVQTGLLGLLSRLVPWQTARAQGGNGCVPMGGGIFGMVSNDCENDVYLRISNIMRTGSDERERTLLEITGSGRTVARPSTMTFPIPCPSSGGSGGIPSPFSPPSSPGSCGMRSVTFIGAPTVTLDLGGNDVWARPVAVTLPAGMPFAIPLPTGHTVQPPIAEGGWMSVSLHLDMGGTDVYMDPSGEYDATSYLRMLFDARDGHPTQGAATGGGVALLFDNWQVGDGRDSYEARAYSQGYGQWGLGMLVDTGGDDEYVAGRFSQGASGRDLNLGAGILLDVSGSDAYRVASGQGFGLGGAFVDLGGADTYTNQKDPFGAPVVKLDVVPGGNLTTLHVRDNNRVWLDGPGQLNLGLGLDTETSVNAQRSDDDLYSDFVETVFGTDPKDSSDNPQTRPLAQTEKVLVDTDGDSYPDFIERAFSTDPKDARSYPLGLPIGPTFLLPAPAGETELGLVTGASPVGARGGDKVIDLRIPFQDAGTVEFACVGAQKLNLSMGIVRVPTAEGDAPQGPCLLVGFDPKEPGTAEAATPTFTRDGAATPAGSTDRFQNRTLHYPVGIFALGDVVSTAYDVDYFLVVDLGGDDAFRNRAGGGLPVRREHPQTGVDDLRFVAPSSVINVDLGGRPTAAPVDAPLRNPGGAIGHDTYQSPANRTLDFIQGSLWGLLLDTQGDDTYLAGSGSQGALGGMLLDLKGRDQYTAGDLSQGATLITTPTSEQARRTPGLPATQGSTRPGETPADQSPNGASDRQLRRAPPGLHLDLGTDDDRRVARNASQGYARGFAGGDHDSAAGAGVLLDQGGNDYYSTTDGGRRGAHVQGVATDGGIGVLVDLKGDDWYTAWGVVSHGAPIGQRDGSNPALRDSERQSPGLAALLDLGGSDWYEYQDHLGTHNRSALRQDNLTIQRAELSKRGGAGEPWSRLYGDPGVHYDGEDASLNAIFGTGTRSFTSLDGEGGATNVDGFYVDMPSARLAIGGPGASVYEREYALVVDLGGDNAYRMNAAGVLSDVLARRDAASPSEFTSAAGNFGGRDVTVPLFPVTFVLDAGTGTSIYEAARGLVQGAGFFSVGVLVDLGGNDRFVALPQAVPSLASSWAAAEPLVDGALSEPLWAALTPHTLRLTGANDSRIQGDFKVRVANDDRTLYLAVEGRTPSRGEAIQAMDRLRVSLNPGRGLTAPSGTPIDETNVSLHARASCPSHDWHYSASAKILVPDATVTGARAQAVACTLFEDGTFIIEMSKPLRAATIPDPQDLDLSYDPAQGFRKDQAQMGFRLAFRSEGIDDEFVWPTGSVRVDGDGAYLRNDDLTEELRDWAVLALASLGEPGLPANVTRTPALSQGAAVAGVGILAHLGTTASSNEYVASDRAQGYGGYRGLGLLLDAGSSDAYRATVRGQGFGDAEALGALVDLEGNDNYHSLRETLGATPVGASALGLFVDMGGRDHYNVSSPAADSSCSGGPEGAPCDVTMPTQLGPATLWRQNGGLGADYLTNDDVRTNLRAAYASSLYGSSRAFVTVFKTDQAGECTGEPSVERIEGKSKYVLSGIVCLRTFVNLAGGRDQGTAAVTDVESLDILVGGVRHITLPRSVAIESSTRNYTFWTKLDTRGLEDGFTRITAVPLIRAVTPGGTGLGERGVVLFYDHAAGAGSFASASTLINNPSVSSLRLWPEFDGHADAVVSPLSADPQKRALVIDWAASHDAGEDRRYGLLQGWSTPPPLSNVPCAPDDARLCDLVPLYLRASDGTISTEQENYPPGSSNRQTQNSGPEPYVQNIPQLQTPLTLYKRDAFHLVLNEHINLLPGTYHTRIEVSLTHPSGEKVTTGDGTKPVVIASEIATTTRSDYGAVDLASTVGPLRDAYFQTKPAIDENLSKLGSAGVLGLAVKELHTACHSPTWSTASGGWGLVCGPFYGDPHWGIVGPCRPLSARNPGQTGYAQQEMYNEMKAWKNVPVCSPIIEDLNETAENDPANLQPVVSLVTGQTETTINQFLSPGDKGALHWNDFFVDAQKPSDFPAILEDEDTITIPAGYGLVMEMFIRSDGLQTDDPDFGSRTFMAAWRQVASGVPGVLVDDGTKTQFKDTMAGPNQQANSTRRTACWGCVPYDVEAVYDDIVMTQIRSQQDGNNIGMRVDERRSNPVPAAFFTYGDPQSRTGEPQVPARLELRVPKEPTAQALVTIEDPLTDEVLVTLHQGAVVGDVRGSPTLGDIRWINKTDPEDPEVVVESHVVYDAPGKRASGFLEDDALRFTENRIRFTGGDLPDGTYRVNVTTWDPFTEKRHIRTSTFVLDRVAPVSVVEAGYAGAASFVGTSIPVRWTTDEQGSGLERTWVFTYNPSTGAVTETKRSSAQNVAWDPIRDAYPATLRTYLHPITGTAREYHFVTISQDRAGNIEMDVNDPPASLGARVKAAAAAKAAAGGVAQIIVDRTVPGVRGDAIEGARIATYQGVDFAFVRAGAPVTFQACARDSDGSNVQAVFFELSLLGQPDAKPRALQATPTGTCADGSHHWSYGGWGTQNVDKEAWPDGVWTIAVQAYDRASNPTKIGMGSLILDAQAPSIRLEPPVFPPGQSAVKPGDRVTLRLYAQDTFGVDDAAIRIDGSPLTKQGTLATRPVRISGLVYQEATLTVDRANLRNGEYELAVRVTDNAGNENVTSFVVPVDFKTFVIPASSLTVTNVTHSTAIVRWTTTEPTTSQVRYGTSPLELKIRTPQNMTLTTEHEVKVEGLSPSTRYFLRAVSSTAGGFLNESDTLEALTGSALYLEALGPAPGTPLRGAVDVRFDGGLLDGNDFVTFTLEAQSAPDAPWTFVTTTTETTGEHALVFNSTRFLDGPEYRLRIVAEHGKDKATATLGPFLSDNTLPRIVVVSPLVATNSTTPRIVAEGEDELARFGSDAAKLLIDGREVQGLVVEPRGSRVLLTYDVVEPLAPGTHAFELRVVDRAGNLAVERWSVDVDGEAPIVSVNPSAFAPGRAAAKLGGTVTLNVTVRDGSGVQSVTADTSALSSQASTRLSRLTGTDTYVGTFPVTDASDEATHPIPVVAVDLAGNAREALVEVEVDNVAPIVSEARPMDVTQTRASLVADANEPIVLVGRVVATAAPVVEASGERLSTSAVLPLAGLLPSRTYHYTVQAMDKAGNVVDLTGRFQTALDTVPPTVVVNVAVLDLLNGTLRLTWAPASDDVGIAAYRIYRSEDGGVSFRPIAEVQGLVFEDVRLPLETRFVYQVVAVDHGGNEGPGSTRLTAFATAVPRLSGGLVTPTVGSTATVFRYVVTYVSPGGVAPAYVRVILDGTAQEMRLEPGGTPETGLTYVYETRLAAHKRDAPHTYSFEAFDGRYTARFPDSGDALRGPLVSGDINAGAAGGVVAFAQRVPLLGAAGLTLALGVAAVAVAALLRRKNP